LSGKAAFSAESKSRGFEHFDEPRAKNHFNAAIIQLIPATPGFTYCNDNIAAGITTEISAHCN
jgi:hypothetical protein